MAASAAWLPGHTDSVLCCEVLRERRLLASGGEVREMLRLPDGRQAVRSRRCWQRRRHRHCCEPGPAAGASYAHFQQHICPSSPEQDGAICLSDLSTLKPVGRINAAHDGSAAVPALCSHPAQEAGLFVAAGSEVLQLDLRAGLGSEAVCRTFRVNADEVNGLAATAANGGWLAAADDAGEVAVVSLAPTAGIAGEAAPPGAGAAAGAAAAAARPPQYKTLRRGHSNIASAVAFRPHRPWELLSGGLDSTVVKWDFSRLRPVQSWSLAGEATASGGEQMWGVLRCSHGLSKRPQASLPLLSACMHAAWLEHRLPLLPCSHPAFSLAPPASLHCRRAWCPSGHCCPTAGPSA